ncbi:MAG: UbiH/UbiF family hydroxylase [Pseudomonadota bacterium]
MAKQSVDIVISGAGVAGLSAACAFGSAGFRVLCVDPTAPVTDREDKGADQRTTAILQPGRRVLETAGVWEKLGHEPSALQVMRIIDAGGVEPCPRVIRAFDAADISDQPFGWNVPNWLLRREMVARVEELDSVELRTDMGVASVLTRESEARVRLTDGTSVRCKLLIGADGRGSTVREAVGIPVTTTRYGQKALAFAVTHPEPHQNVSTEIHRSGGPFTLVPLHDHEGKPCSAIVWMERGAEAQRLAALPVAEFEAEMTARSCGIMGSLTLVSRRTTWPLISQIAARMSAERTALMAEAAHVVPPIGAQGLNMSLADLSTLLDLAEAAPATLGDRAMLDSYHSRRHTEVAIRVTGIDVLNRASMAEDQMLRDARARGLDALYSLRPVRRMLMQLGLGMHNNSAA